MANLFCPLPAGFSDNLHYCKSSGKEVGVHMHNNMQIAFANTIDGIHQGREGRRAGNLRHGHGSISSQSGWLRHPSAPPGLRAILSDHRTILSDLRTILPDLCAVLSDLHASLSDLWAILPDLRASLSDLWTILPDLRASLSGLRTILSDLCAILSERRGILSEHPLPAPGHPDLPPKHPYNKLNTN